MINALNILLDGRVLKWGLDKGTRSGIYFVARNLLLEMYKRKQINIFLYLDKKDIQIINKLNADLGINIQAEKVLTKDSDFSKINSFFSSSFKCPDEVRKYPNVSCYIVLHDVIPLLLPEYFSDSTDWFGELVHSFNKEDYYFSNSEYTKYDFLKYCSELDANKITTMLLATNHTYKPNQNRKDLNRAKQKYNIPDNKKYLFSLCSLEPRKNLIRAVKTFIEFIKKNNIDDLVYVLGGGAWNGFIERLEKEVPDYKKYSDKIIRAGYVDDEDLEILYSNAEWFIYTSQYEGFGMPPLEAMSCGCPVITSNNSSLPEVVGDTGQMIDWDSDEQHIAAYEKYYFDEKFRKSMARKGLERSKQFSWVKAVDVILNKMIEVEKKKSNKPLVTIITPSFNLIKNGRKDWFIQNMESVQNQTYKNIEHIVIDGASTDGTVKLLQQYQEKGWIKYYSEPDKGIYDAMNKGIMKAKGKYVVCLNSDDFYCNNRAIEMLVCKAEEQDADAVFADAIRVNPQTLGVMSQWKGKETFCPWCNVFPCHQTFLIKTDIMKELGLYKLKYKVSADNAFFMRLVNNNKKIIGIDYEIIHFRDGGFSNDNLDVAKQDQITSLFEEYGQYHGLTKLDANYLIHNSFVNMPLNKALVLGSKLGNPNWIQSFFERWINHNMSNIEQTAINKQLNACSNSINKKYYLFDLIPLLKIKQGYGVRRYLLFHFLPVLKVKFEQYKTKSYFFDFIPFTNMSDRYGVYKLRIFGIPVIYTKHN